MKLADLLTADRIIVPLTGEALRDAAQQLLDALERTGGVDDAKRMRTLLAETLPRDVVAAGPAFLLHFRTDAVPTLALAVGVASQPIHRQHDPGKKARIVVLFAAPPGESSHFLRAISAVARAFGREDVIEGLLAAQSAEDVLAVAPFVEADVHEDLTVGDVMVPRTAAARPDTPLGQVSELMVGEDLSALPVVSDDNEVLGMVSDRELLRYLLPAYVSRAAEGRPPRSEAGRPVDPHTLPARDVMDRSVLCVSENQPLAEVARMMLSRGVDQFPVVRDGAFVGVLTKGDIIRRLLGP